MDPSSSARGVLLALDIDAAALLPPDDSATASTTSPTCSACRRRCRSVTCRPPRRSARSPSATRRGHRRPRPTASVRTSRRTSTTTGCRSAPRRPRESAHRFPLDGEYDVPQVELLQRTNFATSSRPRLSARGRDHHRRRARPRRDDRRQRRSGDDVRAPNAGTATPIEARLTFRVPVKAGPVRSVSPSSMKSPRGAETRAAVPSRYGGHSTGPAPHVETVTITGRSCQRSGDTPSRRAIFTCRPGPRRARSESVRDARSSRRSRAAPIAGRSTTRSDGR